MTRIDYNDALHRTYHEARRLSPETATLWMAVARGYVGERNAPAILDLGCGTGRFTPLLADAFGARVIGVEPADKMRSVAQEKSRHPNVQYLKGTAERIPAQDRSFDVGWVSMVVHHVSDLDACARELHRVVRPGGLVLIRNSFSGRLQTVRAYEFFPDALAIDNARLPKVETVRSAFEAIGFGFVDFRGVEQIIDTSLTEHVARIRQRGVSTFELISDEEFERGIRRMEQAARDEDPPKPVTERIDFLVMHRGGGAEE
ncbi:MAG: class I SAM-dependent methyltransferase [Planctomycetes bacterium]|nr:class I SAM-dependent methyltransferase [Planctomycetota bacterium]